MARSIHRRGINEGIEVVGAVGERISLTLNKWAKLDFFIKGTLEGSLIVQLQTPLNFFEEIGLATRVHAVLKAAVAIGLESDLTVGQIINRVTQRPEMSGPAGQLFKTIMDEIQIEGVLYGQLAVAVMAYADLIATFDIFGAEGFELVCDAGYGFIVGGGYRCYLKANIDSLRRVVQRLSDIFIYEVLREVKKLGLSRDSFFQLEFMFRNVFRLSYELGFRLKHYDNSSDPAYEIRRSVIEIFIGEGQWWILRRISQSTGTFIQNLLNNSNLRSSGDVLSLLRLIETTPMEAKELRSYTQKFVQNANQITPRIHANIINSWLQNISALWACLTLLEVLSRSFADGTSFFYGEPKVTSPIPERVRSWIYTQLQKPESEELTLNDLKNYLLGEPLSSLLDRETDVPYFLEQLYTKFFFSESPTERVRLLLNYLPESISPEDIYIEYIRSDLSLILERQLSANLKNRIGQRFTGQQEISILIQSALFPMTTIVTDHVLTSLINGNISNEDQ
ncbi:hypothetical protein SAMN03159341_12447 [Paenibacillus sp. 1_12]|uniref:hypothetical protein n=1 Tax=Paenibacillus sp. 1_12 TaxID=1566278 RepID=UPI0008F25D8D|nr:hypothetical protein [Paenibacillus sp. 1_12]SFM28879.1 hypothetical protein SAMN03159341_12447 [Paenibacillus sp. 1_12]